VHANLGGREKKDVGGGGGGKLSQIIFHESNH